MRCQCSPDCEAVVKTKGKKFARGHSPASHKDYEKKERAISKSMREFYASGGEGSFKGRRHTKKSKRRMGSSRKVWYSKHKKEFLDTMKVRSKNRKWLASVKKNARLGGLAKKGIKHTKAAKKKISRSVRLSFASGRSSWNKGSRGLQVAWNKGLTKGTDSRMKQISDSVHLAYVEGRKETISATKFKKWYDGPNRRVLMRSGWEVKFAEWLDRKGIGWLYEPKRFLVTVQGVSQTYTPDFYLPKDQQYVEVKGQMDKQSQQRYVAFRQQYPKLHWTWLVGVHLRKLGVFREAA